MAQISGNDNSDSGISLQRVPISSLIIKGVQDVLEQDKVAKL